MKRKIPSSVAAWILRRLPSSAIITTGVQFVPHLAPCSGSQLLIFLMYCFGSALSVNIRNTPTTEKYHSSCSESHAVRIGWSSKSWVLSYSLMRVPPSLFSLYLRRRAPASIPETAPQALYQTPACPDTGQTFCGQR